MKGGGLAFSNPIKVTALLNNGASIFAWAGSQLTDPHIWVWFDIDGPKKGKNMLGADVFGMHTSYRRGGVWMAPLHNQNIGEDYVRNTPMYGCSKDINNVYAGYWCGGLIQLNNWKIPDDYPVKF